MRMDFQVASDMLLLLACEMINHSLGDHDVSASSSNTRLDGEGYRVTSQRGIHLAKPFPRFQCAFKKLDGRIFSNSSAIAKTSDALHSIFDHGIQGLS